MKWRNLVQASAAVYGIHGCRSKLEMRGTNLETATTYSAQTDSTYEYRTRGRLFSEGKTALRETWVSTRLEGYEPVVTY